MGSSAPSRSGRVLRSLGALGVRQGFLFIAVIVINWTVSDKIGQNLEARHGVNSFLTTVICNSLYLVFLGVHGIKRLLGKGTHWIPVLEFGESTHPSLSLSERQLFRTAGCVSVFWFTGQWMYAASLRATSEQSHGILANTAILWTFLLSAALRLDNFTASKALFCLINFVGVAFDTLARNLSAPDESEVSSWWGGYLAIGSALFYALYTCILKSVLPNDEKVDMMGFLGYVGFWNTLIFAPVAVILAATGVIDATEIETGTVAFIIVMGLIDNVCSDYLWARGVLLTTPAVVTCGVSLQTPLGMIVDLCTGKGGYLRGQIPGTLAFGGAVLAIMGFSGVVFETPEDWEAQKVRMAATPRRNFIASSAEAPEEEDDDEEEEGDLEAARRGGAASAFVLSSSGATQHKHAGGDGGGGAGGRSAGKGEPAGGHHAGMVLGGGSKLGACVGAPDGAHHGASAPLLSRDAEEEEPEAQTAPQPAPTVRSSRPGSPGRVPLLAAAQGGGGSANAAGAAAAAGEAWKKKKNNKKKKDGGGREEVISHQPQQAAVIFWLA